MGYGDLWPGIAASFYGRGDRLEYDLELAPGADPRRIGWRSAARAGLPTRQDAYLFPNLNGGRMRRQRVSKDRRRAGVTCLQTSSHARTA